MIAEPLKIEIKVTPRVSRDEVVGMRDGVLSVQVTAPLVDAGPETLNRLDPEATG